MIDILPKKWIVQMFRLDIGSAMHCQSNTCQETNHFKDLIKRRGINSYLYIFPKDAALLSDKTSITQTVLVIKGEWAIKYN